MCIDTLQELHRFSQGDYIILEFGKEQLSGSKVIYNSLHRLVRVMLKVSKGYVYTHVFKNALVLKQWQQLYNKKNIHEKITIIQPEVKITS